ncbi:hypothetical protein GCM10020254_78740 [Streptomyces goshikiensis]
MVWRRYRRKAVKAAMLRSPAASRAPPVRITAIIANWFPRDSTAGIIAPSRAPSRDTARSRSASAARAPAARASARYALMVVSASRFAVKRWAICPMATCCPLTLSFIRRRISRMSTVSTASAPTVTRVSTQSIHTMTARVAATVSAARGNWVAMSTTWRSRRASEVTRAARSPVPWAFTTPEGQAQAVLHDADAHAAGQAFADTGEQEAGERLGHGSAHGGGAHHDDVGAQGAAAGEVRDHFLYEQGQGEGGRGGDEGEQDRGRQPARFRAEFVAQPYGGRCGAAGVVAACRTYGACGLVGHEEPSCWCGRTVGRTVVARGTSPGRSGVRSGPEGRPGRGTAVARPVSCGAAVLPPPQGRRGGGQRQTSVLTVLVPQLRTLSELVLARVSSIGCASVSGSSRVCRSRIAMTDLLR